MAKGRRDPKDILQRAKLKKGENVEETPRENVEGLLPKADEKSFYGEGRFSKLQRGITLPINREEFEPYFPEGLDLSRGVEGLERARALRQSAGEKWLAFANQVVVGEIIGQSIAGIGSLGALPKDIYAEVMGENATFNNALIEFGNSITDWAKEKTPIYRREPGKTFDVGDLGWWLENGVSVASSLSLLVPALGVTKLGSVLAKATRLSSRLSRSTREVMKLMNNASIMRNGENYREALGVVNDVRDQALETFEDDEAYQQWLSTEEGSEFMLESSDISKENAADYIAAKAGWRSYAINSTNIVFDVIQAGALMKTNFLTRTNMSKTKGVLDALEGAPKGFWQGLGRSVRANGRLVASILGEGVEEGVNFVGTEEGNKYAEDILGGETPGAFTSIASNIGEYIGDPHLWESAFWGMMGGGVFEAAGASVQALYDKEGKRDDEIKIGEIKSRNDALRVFNAGLSEIFKKHNNDELSYEEANSAVNLLKENIVFDLGFNAANAGNVDLVLEQIDSGQFKEAIAKDIDFSTMKKKGRFVPIDKVVSNIKEQILSIENAYNKAVNFYENKDVDQAAKHGLTKLYAEHTFNAFNRQQNIFNQKEKITELNKDPLYMERQKAGETIEQTLNIKALEKMKAENKGFTEFADAKIKQEKELNVTPANLKDINVQEQVNERAKLFIHEASKMASENYLAEAKKEKFIKGFDKAIKEQKEKAKERIEQKRKTKVKSDVDSLVDEDDVESSIKALEAERKRLKDTGDELEKATGLPYIGKKLADLRKKKVDEGKRTPAPEPDEEASAAEEEADRASARAKAEDFELVTVEPRIVDEAISAVAAAFKDTKANAKALLKGVMYHVKRRNLKKVGQLQSNLVELYNETKSESAKVVLEVLIGYTRGLEVKTEHNGYDGVLVGETWIDNGDTKLYTIDKIVEYKDGFVEAIITKTNIDGSNKKRSRLNLVKSLRTGKLDRVYQQEEITAEEEKDETNEEQTKSIIKDGGNEFNYVFSKVLEEGTETVEDKIVLPVAKFYNIVSSIEPKLKVLEPIITQQMRSTTVVIYVGDSAVARKKEKSVRTEQDGTIVFIPDNISETDRIPDMFVHEVVHSSLRSIMDYTELKNFIGRLKSSIFGEATMDVFSVNTDMTDEVATLIGLPGITEGDIEEAFAILLTSPKLMRAFKTTPELAKAYSNFEYLLSDPDYSKIKAMVNKIQSFNNMKEHGTEDTGSKGYHATPTALNHAEAYGINIETIEGTGKDGRVTAKDVVIYAKKNKIKSLQQLKDESIASHTDLPLSDGTNVYLPAIVDGIDDGVVDADFYNKNVSERFGPNAIKVTQEQLEKAVKAILSPESNTGAYVRLSSLQGSAIGIYVEDVLVGFLNTTKGLERTIKYAKNLQQAESLEEVDKLDTPITPGEKKLREWKIKELAGDETIKPFGNAINTLETNLKHVKDLRSNVQAGKPTYTQIVRKTSGNMVKGPVRPITEVFPNVDEVFFIDKNSHEEILTSSKDEDRIFVRNPHATDHFNADMKYYPGWMYIMVPGANSVQNDLQSYIPVPLEIGNIPEDSLDTVISTITKLANLGIDGADMARDERVQNLKKKLEAYINIESTVKDKKGTDSANYMNVTDDQIRFSFMNEKTGEYNHVHIVFKARFSPHIYLTREKHKGVIPWKGRRQIPVKDTNNVRNVLKETLKRKPMNVDIDRLKSSDEFAEGKTYFEYLKDSEVFQTDIGVLSNPQGEVLTDSRGNPLPNVTSKYTSGNTDSNLVLTLSTKTQDSPGPVKEKSGIDTNTARKPDDDPQRTLFRRVQEGDQLKEKEDLEEVKRWWKATFGDNVPLDISLANVIVRNGIEAWGVFEDAAVKMSRLAVRGTAFHEAYHAVHWLYLNESERISLIEEAKERWGKDMSDLQAEEALADGFMDYMLKAGDKNLNGSPAIIRWFKKLYDLLMNWFFDKGYMNENEIDALYRKIDSGGFNYQPDTLNISNALGKVRTKAVPSFTHAEEAEAVGVISKYLIEYANDNPGITFADVRGLDVKNYVKRRFAEQRPVAEEAGKVENFDQVLNNFDVLFTESIRHLELQFDLQVSDKIDSDEELSKAWDDTQIFNKSGKEKISFKVKSMIMTTSSNEAGHFLGLEKYLDFNKVYPYLQRNMEGANSLKEMTDRLIALSNFDSTIGNIAAKLLTDQNMASAWYTQFYKSNPDRLVVLVNADEVKVDVSNKSTSHFMLSDTWADKIKAMMDAEDVDMSKVNIELNNHIKTIVLATTRGKSVNQLASSISDAFRLLNIDMSSETAEMMITDSHFINDVSEFKSTKDFVKNVVVSALSGISTDITASIEEGESVFNSYGRLNTLASYAIKYQYDLVESSSFNVNGDNVFSYIDPQFISKFFDKLKMVVDPKAVNKQQAKQDLVDYLKTVSTDSSMLYSMWMWTDSAGDGFFNTSDKTREEMTVDNLNMDFLESFALKLLDGVKNTVTKNNEQFKTMLDNTWDFSKLALYLGSSNSTSKALMPLLIPVDSGNMFFINTNRIAGVDKSGRVRRKIDGNFNPLWVSVYNTAFQEIERMKAARDLLFKQNESGDWVAKEHKRNAEIGDPDFVDYERLQQNYHFTSRDDNDMPILMEDGRPTGRVFQFQNIRSLNDAKITGYNVDEEFDLLENGLFVADLYADETIMTSVKKIIGRNVDKFIIAEVNKAKENYAEIKETLDNIEEYGRYSSYDQFVGEYAINSYLHRVELFNWFYGQQAEYKNDKDTNKRAKQVQAPGVPNAPVGDKYYYGATLKDITLASAVYDNIGRSVAESLKRTGKYKGMSYSVTSVREDDADRNPLEEAVFKIIKDYRATVVGDAQGYISLSRYIDLLNKYDKMTPELEALIERLDSPTYKPTVKEIETILQPLKGFYYGREFDAYTGRMYSNQLKYSLMPLIPSLVFGTEAEKLYKWMNKNNLGEVFFESAEKVGITNIIDITDGKGNIVQEKLNEYSRSNGYVFKQYNNANWQLQLEVPDHIVDTDNKLGTQIAKIILANIDLTGTYNLNGQEVTGKEMIDKYMDVMVTNIEESAQELVNDIGAEELPNGRWIIPDKTKLSSFLQRETERRKVSYNYTDAIKIVENENGELEFNMPLYISNLANKWESILTSTFSNNVTDQRIAGGSAVVASGAFLTSILKTGNVLGSETGVDVVAQEAIRNLDKAGINWLDRKIGDRTLRIQEMNEDGTKVLKTEGLLPAWSRKFFKEQDDGTYRLDDINNIPEDIRTLLWYRIPYEGKHSDLVVEVVGFLPQSAGNIIILPQEAITQSGEDMDIDKRFGIYREFEVDRDGDYVSIDFQEEVDDTLFDRWVKSRAGREVKREYLNNPDEALKNANKQVKRFTTRKENTKAQLENVKKLTADTAEGILEYFNNALAIEAKTLPELIEVIESRREVIQENLDAIQNMYETYWLEPETDRKVQAAQRELFNADKLYLDTLKKINELSKDFGEDVKKAKVTVDRKYELIGEYVDKRRQIIREKQREAFDVLPIQRKNTTQARNNRILDTMIAIKSNPIHYAETMSPSSFDDGIAAIDEVNELLDTTEEEANPVTDSAQRFFRKRSIDGAAMKGMAANSNAFLAIAQVAKMKLRSDLGIVMTYTKDDISVKDAKAKYGKENVKVDGDKIMIRHRNMGWNNDGSYENVAGEITTKHASQLLAQILDIVKEGVPYNLNTYTFNIVATMLNVHVPLRNAALYIRQPMINDIANNFFSSRSVVRMVTGNEISQVKNQYQQMLFSVKHRLGKYKKNKTAVNFYQRVKSGKFYISREDMDKHENYNDYDVYVRDTIKRLFDYDILEDGNDIGFNYAFDIETMRKDIELSKKYNLNTNLSILSKEELEELENWLRRQLIVGETFIRYKKAGEATEDAIAAFKPDRVGVGPTLNNHVKLEHDIEKATYYPTAESPELGRVAWNPEGARVVVDVDGNEIPATLAVYPNYFQHRAELDQYNVPEHDTTHQSVYPVLDAYRLYGYATAYDVLSPEFMKYTPAVQRTVNRILADLGRQFSVRLADDISNYVSFAISSQMPYFGRFDNSRVLGIGMGVKTDPNMDIETFERLSTANKVMVLQEKYGNTLSRMTNVLNYLQPKISKGDIERTGLHSISFINTKTDNITDNDLVESLTELWNGKIGDTYDPMIEDLGKDLIAYNFFTTGFTMRANSISKLIHPDIQKDIGYDEFMREMHTKMQNPEALNQSYDTLLEGFVRSNTHNSVVVPTVDNRRKSSAYNPDINTGLIRVSAEDLVKESGRIVGATYLNVPIYRTLLVDGKRRRKKVNEQLYKLADPAAGVYVPISKLGNRHVIEFGEQSILPENQPAFTPEMYEAFMDSEKQLNVKGKKYPGDNTYEATMFNYASQYIGDLVVKTGKAKYSKVPQFKSLFGDTANTGNYTMDDLVMVSVQRKEGGVEARQIKRNLVKDGKLQGAYKNVAKALMQGATVMVLSPTDNSGAYIPSHNRQYYIGDYFLRRHLDNQVSKGNLAKRIENGVAYYALKEDNLQTISRRLTDLPDDQSTEDGNVKCETK